MSHGLLKGFWQIICDTSNGAKTMEKSLIKLQQDLPELFPIPPKLCYIRIASVLDIRKKNQLVFYVSNDSSEEIERSAKAIRSRVDFPFIMYYYKNRISEDSNNILQYMHTPCHELYEYCIDYAAESFWKPISKKQRPSATLDELLQSQMTVSGSTHLLTKEEDIEETTSLSFDELRPSQVTGRDHLPVVQEDLDKDTSTPFNELLPSKVTDRDHIHFPSNEEEFKRVTHEKGGKWIVHCSNLETLDSFWKLLRPLFEKGVLVGLKSCTAKSTTYKMSPMYRTKAVMCYTADADCKSSVRIAAENISNCIRYKIIMYYKTNEASLSGKYRHEGYKGVTKYMYTCTGKMFERDSFKRWKAVMFSKETQ